MIVVVGSRHDTVAVRLVASWPDAALCSAEDLVRPGWCWYVGRDDQRTWVVDGRAVPDERITGVFIRRSTVYPEELVTTHADDRTFLAAETRALLALVLSATSARVVNPVVDGAFGEESLRPERWTAQALKLGIEHYPFRVAASPGRRKPPRVAWRLEVVGDRVFGSGPKLVTTAAQSIAAALGLDWATCAFDRRYRLLGVTCGSPPGQEAADALGRLLLGEAATG